MSHADKLMIPLAYSLGFRYSMSLYVGLYLRQILYSWYEKVSRFKSPKNYTVRTGYFWEVENKLKVLLDKVFSKFLWNFRAFCLLVPNIGHLINVDMLKSNTGWWPGIKLSVSDVRAHWICVGNTDLSGAGCNSFASPVLRRGLLRRLGRSTYPRPPQKSFSKLFYRFRWLNMSFEKVKISIMSLVDHVKTPVQNLIISDLL